MAHHQQQQNPVGVVAEKEAEIILPPPSPSNPVPSLPAALRVDNQEQLLSLLRTDPHGPSKPSRAASGGGGVVGSPPFRQVLVFGTESLRTLLLRQVLSDPHARTFGKAQHKKKVKNWDPHLSFPIPHRGLDIVGTRVLFPSPSTFAHGGGGDECHYSGHALLKTKTDATGEGGAEVCLKGEPSSSWDSSDETAAASAASSDCAVGVDVVTYFLRPSDLSQTQCAAQTVRGWKKGRGSAGGGGGGGYRTHHRLVYLPQPTAIVQKVLANLGLAAAPNVSVHRLQLDVFPLETDVISLEYDNATRECEVEGTPSEVVTAAARSILKLQDVVGKIPRWQAFGPVAEEVVRKALNMTVEEYLSSSSSGADYDDHHRPELQESGPGPVPAGDVSALVVLDRKVDLVTPMVTPLTYEGLLDDVIGIDCGFLKVDVDTINPEDDKDDESKSSDKKPPGASGKGKADGDGGTGGEIVALAVNGSDPLYAEVRNQHVERYGSFLQNQAKAMSETHANFTSHGKKKDLSEIHQFVKNIPAYQQNLRSLTNHIHLADLVKLVTKESAFRERWQLEHSMLEGETCLEQLEDLVATQYPPYRFLRLLCLQSLASGGIKSSRYDALRRDVVQTYGYEYLFVLNNLEKAGLLRRREGLWMDAAPGGSAASFNRLRKDLILINDGVDTVEPDDISYVSSGYAPLTVRLLQTTLKGWTGPREEILKDTPGRLIDITQRNPPEDLAAALRRPVTTGLAQWVLEESAVASSSSSAGAGGGGGGGGSSRKPVLMVMYVGGVTYTELAALRFLSKRPSFPFHIICCTTKIVNGSGLLRSLS